MNLLAYIISCSAVLTGGMIYILWREDTIRFLGWLDSAGMSAPVEAVRAYSLPLYSPMPEWIIYSLPNGLWAFAYALLIVHLWRDNPSNIKYVWFASIPAMCIGYELLQYVGALQGVFCYNDLFLSVLGVGFGIFIGIRLNK